MPRCAWYTGSKSWRKGGGGVEEQAYQILQVIVEPDSQNVLRCVLPVKKVDE
jgi:hypothetical protein